MYTQCFTSKSPNNYTSILQRHRTPGDPSFPSRNVNPTGNSTTSRFTRFVVHVLDRFLAVSDTQVNTQICTRDTIHNRRGSVNTWTDTRGSETDTGGWRRDPAGSRSRRGTNVKTNRSVNVRPSLYACVAVRVVVFTPRDCVCGSARGTMITFDTGGDRSDGKVGNDGQIGGEDGRTLLPSGLVVYREVRIRCDALCDLHVGR